MKKYMTGAVHLPAVTTGMMMAWRVATAQPKELNLGILGGQNATQQISGNQRVKTFLDKKLNMDTKLCNSSDYSGVIQGLLGGKINVALSIPPSSYASAYINNSKAVDTIDIAVDDKDQSRGYRSVVIVKADSPYKMLDDSKGKAFGFANPNSTSGYLIPNRAFKGKFGSNADNKYNNTFSSVIFSGGHEQGTLGVLNDQSTGVATWTSMVDDYNTGYTTDAFNRPIRMDHPDLMKQIHIIRQSPLIPNGPILVSGALPTDFKAKVVAAIKKLDAEDHACFIKAAGGIQHINPGSVADFQQIIDMKRELVSAH